MTDQTLLLRQVNPSWIQAGRVTSQAFMPTPKDEGFLSTYNGSLIKAEAAWNHYTETLRLPSTGVLGVSVEECTSLELPTREDPDLFPEHAVIDFTGCEGRKSRERKAKFLRSHADARSWQYQSQ